MSIHPAREALRRSMNSLRLGRKREALALAEAAHRMVVEMTGGLTKDGFVGAWYGFLLGTVGGRPKEGLEVCRLVAAECFWEPRAHEYLARLEQALLGRRAAVETCERGLTLHPEDSGLRAFRESLGVRRAPIVPFLDRNHPVNKWLGQMRARRSRPTFMSSASR